MKIILFTDRLDNPIEMSLFSGCEFESFHIEDPTYRPSRNVLNELVEDSNLIIFSDNRSYKSIPRSVYNTTLDTVQMAYDHGHKPIISFGYATDYIIYSYGYSPIEISNHEINHTVAYDRSYYAVASNHTIGFNVEGNSSIRIICSTVPKLDNRFDCEPECFFIPNIKYLGFKWNLVNSPESGIDLTIKIISKYLEFSKEIFNA